MWQNKKNECDKMWQSSNLGWQPCYSVRKIFCFIIKVFWLNQKNIIFPCKDFYNCFQGDFTRTGERKFTGLMKDGMNSANRLVIPCNLK